MKRQGTFLNLFAVMAILAMLAVTGCAKDDGFAPCQHEEENVGNAKSSVGAAIDLNDAAGKPGQLRGTSGGSSISDDGDDVGDGERNKKKKPNN